MPRLAMYGGTNRLPTYLSGLMPVPQEQEFLNGILDGRGRAQLAIAMRPADYRMVCVAFKRTGSVVLCEQNGTDLPDFRQMKHVHRRVAWSLLEEMQQGIGFRDPVPEQRGRWTGTWEWVGPEPAIKLQRSISTYLIMRLTGTSLAWNTAFEVRNRYYTGLLNPETLSPRPWLQDAIEQGYAEGKDLAAQAGALRDLTRRAALDQEYRQKHPVRLPKEPKVDPVDRAQERLDPEQTAKSKPEVEVIGWTTEELGHRHALTGFTPVEGGLRGQTQENGEAEHTHTFDVQFRIVQPFLQIFDGETSSTKLHSHRLRFVSWIDYTPIDIFVEPTDNSVISNVIDQISALGFAEAVRVLKTYRLTFSASDTVDLFNLAGEAIAKASTLHPSLDVSRASKAMDEFASSFCYSAPKPEALGSSPRAITKKAERVAQWFADRDMPDMAEQIRAFTSHNDAKAFTSELRAQLDKANPHYSNARTQVSGLYQSLKRVAKKKNQPTQQQQQLELTPRAKAVIAALGLDED